MRCKHCDPTSTVAKCPRCAILLPKLTLAHEVLKPEAKALETVRGVLSGVDLESLRNGDESELQRIWEELIGFSPSIGAVPGLEAANLGMMMRLKNGRSTSNSITQTSWTIFTLNSLSPVVRPMSEGGMDTISTIHGYRARFRRLTSPHSSHRRMKVATMRNSTIGGYFSPH